MTDPIAALSERQRQQIEQFAAELARMNRRLNLVAPSTLGDAERVHLRHSLALAHRALPPEATVVDWGAGGGLPTVPLAIAFPETQFVAVDAVGKKMEAVRLFARRLGLDNLSVWHGRAEAYDGPAPHLCVSRATAPLATLWSWTERVLVPWERPLAPEAWAPGSLLTLKGGDLTDEIAALPGGLTTHVTPLAEILGPGYPEKVLTETRPA
ncbi:MAG: 16S rRNA (guanine(527)-N(7))-methyltransferase RsmG [Bacteroidota bacterium]